MIDLFVRANIFDAHKKQEMTPDFFWSLVRKPKKVGTKKVIDLENPDLTSATKLILSRLCGKEDNSDTFDDFEMETTNDDDDNVSHTSSCFNQNNIHTGQLGLKDINRPDNEDDNDKPPVEN